MLIYFNLCYLDVYLVYIFHNFKMSNKYIVKCCVPNCFSDGKTRFGVPKSSLIFWEKAIGTSLNTSSKICACHFEKGDIIDTWESGSGTNKYSVSNNYYLPNVYLHLYLSCIT